MSDPIPVLVLVGKPGAGKSEVGRILAQLLAGEWLSMGHFIRDTLHLRTPLSAEQNKSAYGRLKVHLQREPAPSVWILDNNPYSPSSYDELRAVLADPIIEFLKVVEIHVPDETALTRMRIRRRVDNPGFSHEQRLRYYTKKLPRRIEAFVKEGVLLRVDNSQDDCGASCAREIIRQVPRLSQMYARKRTSAGLAELRLS